MKTKNLVQKILIMSGHLCSKMIKRFVIFLTIFVIIAVIYYPFCKLSMIETEYDWTKSSKTDIRDKILDYEERILKYKNMMYITKGMSLESVSKEGEKVRLYLGWDNCIHIKKGKIQKILHVNKMRDLFYKNMIIDQYNVIQYRGDKDSTYLIYEFSDVKNNIVYIYQQLDDLPYGGRKYGFSVHTDNLNYSSGENGNYFNY